MAFASHIVTVRRLKKYIDDVIGKKANLPNNQKTIIDNIEAIGRLDSTKQNKEDNTLDTTSKTIVGAINEHESDITQINADLSDMLIQHLQVSGTTDAYGRLFTNIDISNKIVVALLPYEHGKIAQQVRLSTNQLCIRYINSDSGSAYANQDVGCNVYTAKKFVN